MTWLEIGQSVLIVTGVLFFTVGTVGLLRFPDVFTRLHALTKADNIGLGLVVFGLLPSAAGIASALKLLLIWLLVLAASATSSHLVARRARERGLVPWQRGDAR
jgi:multicomponent Na+:H+ antiporter subunit G